SLGMPVLVQPTIDVQPVSSVKVTPVINSDQMGNVSQPAMNVQSVNISQPVLNVQSVNVTQPVVAPASTSLAVPSLSNSATSAILSQIANAATWSAGGTAAAMGAAVAGGFDASWISETELSNGQIPAILASEVAFGIKPAVSNIVDMHDAGS